MSKFNFSNNPLKDWHSDKNWNLLDATAKGFFAQIVLVASQTKPYGHFPSDEKKLKRLLGLPSKVFEKSDYDSYVAGDNDISRALKKYFDEKSDRFNISSGMLEVIEYSIDKQNLNISNEQIFRSYEAWLNYLWEHKWKPALSDLIFTIDAELTVEFPELCEKIGDYFVPIAYNIGMVHNNQTKEVQLKSEKTKKTRTKKKEVIFIEPEKLYLEYTSDFELSEDGLPFTLLDIEKHFNFKNVFKAFTVPLSEKEKHTIWDLGISLISGGSSNEQVTRKMQAVMAKALKEFGRDALMEAITKMSLIKEKQLNPQAYFFKLLRISREEEEKAKKQAESNIGVNRSLLRL